MSIAPSISTASYSKHNLFPAGEYLEYRGVATRVPDGDEGVSLPEGLPSSAKINPFHGFLPPVPDRRRMRCCRSAVFAERNGGALEERGGGKVREVRWRSSCGWRASYVLSGLVGSLGRAILAKSAGVLSLPDREGSNTRTVFMARGTD